MIKNSMRTDIETFMRACGQEVKETPGIPDNYTMLLRINLMVEELLGAKEPVGGLIQSKSDELVASMYKKDIVGIADGIADMLYVVIGTAAAYGINIQEVFDEVHRSNMSKAIFDEKTKTYSVIRREDGKILKPDTYSEAEIGPIIQNQMAS